VAWRDPASGHVRWSLSLGASASPLPLVQVRYAGFCSTTLSVERVAADLVTVNTRKGLWLAVCCCTGNAFFLIAYKLAAGLGDTADATLLMLTAAALLNTVTSIVQEGGRIAVPRDPLSWWLALGLSAMTLLGNEMAVAAVRLISAPLTSVLQQTQVLFVALLGLYVLSERVTPRFWLGSAIAALGLYLIQSYAPAQLVAATRNTTNPGLGILMATGSAASFAVMSVYTRRYIFRIRPVAVNALRLWISLALWFVVHMRLPHAPMQPRFVIYCALAGVFGPYLSRTALMYALTHISPTRTTLVGLLTPAITMLPAYWVFGSVPSQRELLGSLIMIAGVAIPILEQRTAARAQLLDHAATDEA
jgi:drug/metabolite transporter (DMT)-like permease